MPPVSHDWAPKLLPPAQSQRVMIVGGGGYDMHNQAPAINAAVADLSAAPPAYTATAPLHESRMHLNAVVLPDRTVLVSGGAAMPEDPTTAALDAEIYDQAVGAWTLAARSRVPRLYHSIAFTDA